MKNKTFFICLLLLISLNIGSCSSTTPNNNPATVEEAQKQLAKKDKKNSRAAKKAKKASHKRYWKTQSKESKKSIKKNLKFQISI